MHLGNASNNIVASARLGPHCKVVSISVVLLSRPVQTRLDEKTNVSHLQTMLAAAPLIQRRVPI